MTDKHLIPRPRVLDHGRDPTRARPEPWFVGSGRGLMFGVLALVAILVGVRVVSLMWLAEQGWSWFRSQETAPEPDRSPARSSPNLPDWITPADYPADARAARAEGTVELSWTVGRDGRVAACRIDKSSGHPALDTATCRLLVARGRYNAVSPTGPDLRRFSTAYAWRLPPVPDSEVASPAIGQDEASWITANDYPAESVRREEEGTTRLRWTIGSDGAVRDCEVVEPSGFDRLDRAGCAALEYRGRYTPARDRQGRPVATTKTRRVVWRLPTG